MLVVAYWWRVHPGKEAQFRSAWRQITRFLRRRSGSFGSRLLRNQDGRFVSISEWPDDAAYRAAIEGFSSSEMIEMRASFEDAVAESEGEPMFKMTVTDDLLVGRDTITSAA